MYSAGKPSDSIQRVICAYCQDDFSSTYIARHTKSCSHNPHATTYACSLCSKVYHFKKSLAHHIRVQHAGANSYTMQNNTKYISKEASDRTFRTLELLRAKTLKEAGLYAVIESPFTDNTNMAVASNKDLFEAVARKDCDFITAYYHSNECLGYTVVNEYNNTLLHEAVQTGNIHLVLTILDNSPNLSTLLDWKNNDQLNVLEIAEKNNQFAIKDAILMYKTIAHRNN